MSIIQMNSTKVLWWLTQKCPDDKLQVAIVTFRHHDFPNIASHSWHTYYVVWWPLSYGSKIYIYQWTHCLLPPMLFDSGTMRNVRGIIMFVIYLLQFGWVPQHILPIKLSTSIYRNYIIVTYVEGIIVIYKSYRKMLTHSRLISW